MKRLDYEAPTMEEIVVEMEQGFLTGSNGPKDTPIVTEGTLIKSSSHTEDFEIDLSNPTDHTNVWE